MGFEVGQDRFHTPADGELLIDMMQMSLYGIDRNTQLIRNLLVAPTCRSTSEDVSLAFCQLRELWTALFPRLAQCLRNGVGRLLMHHR